MGNVYREWIIKLYEKYGLDRDSNSKVYSHFEEGISNGIIPEGTLFDTFTRYCRRVKQYLIYNGFFDKVEDTNDVIDYNIKLYKQNQRLRDLNTIKDKSLRESSRVDNLLIELNDKFISLLEQQQFKLEKLKPVNYKVEDRAIVVLLSDLHGGEVVDLPDNKYNYEIMSKRLKKYAMTIKEYAKLNKVKKIIIFSLGDLINANRILSKILMNADSQVKSVFTTTYILSQFIQDLAQNYKVHYNFTVGNESRVTTPMDYSMPSEKILLSDNFDFAIANILKILFKDNDRVIFHDNSYEEAVVSFYDKNFFLNHGHNIDVEKTSDIDKIVRKYSMKGIKLDAITVGHIHSTYIKNNGVMVIRNSSLVGANAYSESKGYSSRASQTIIIVDKDSITPIPIDLQNYNDIDGYDYPKTTEAFNSMFDKTGTDETVVVKIVI